MRDLIKDTQPLIEEIGKALAPGGFELGTSRLRNRRYNQFTTTNVQTLDDLICNNNFFLAFDKLGHFL